jgi:disulfide bond formation protein DsbB
MTPSSPADRSNRCDALTTTRAADGNRRQSGARWLTAANFLHFLTLVAMIFQSFTFRAVSDPGKLCWVRRAAMALTL